MEQSSGPGQSPSFTLDTGPQNVGPGYPRAACPSRTMVAFMTHSSVLAWRIPWTEELAGYSPWGHTELDTTEATWHTGSLRHRAAGTGWLTVALRHGRRWGLYNRGGVVKGRLRAGFTQSRAHGHPKRCRAGPPQLLGWAEGQRCAQGHRAVVMEQ